MGQYRYTAITPTGERLEGTLSAANELAALGDLESRKLTPVRVLPVQPRRSWSQRIPPGVLGTSYTQLADLLHSGVPLLRGLRLLAGRRRRPALAAVYQELADQVEKGGDLATAMVARPQVFAPVHVAMVRAGEKGGFLEQVLSRLGELLLRQDALRSKVIGNLIYPAILVLLGSGALIAIFGFMIPIYRPMFERIKGGPPFLTRVVFAISDALTRYGLVTAGVLAALIAGGYFLLRRPEVRDWVERWKTRLPLIGEIVRGYATARFCQLLGAMLGNGVPMLAALQIAKDGAGNRLLRTAIETAAEEVGAGRGLSGPLRDCGLFDDDVVEMIAVGEASNNLDAVLPKVGTNLENRLDSIISTAVRLIEPLLLLVIAGVIGLVAMALILPMSRLGSSL